MKVESPFKDIFDLKLFASMLLLVAIGIAAIYSATQSTEAQKSLYEKQIISFFIGLTSFFFFYGIPRSFLKNATASMYIAAILLLIAVLAVGISAGGQRSWFYILGFSFQPSEFAKLATVLAAASYLGRDETNIDSLKDIGITMLFGLAAIGLILMQPDMGTSMVFIFFLLIMLFWRGVSLFWLFVVLSPAVVALSALFGGFILYISLAFVLFALLFFKKDLIFSAAILTLNIAAAFFVDYVYGMLSPHQKIRISSFLDPSADPLGSGYNAIQAQIAIGSGGIFGKGFLCGNQTQLQFIPEQWTDFIFCVIGEEFGFIGSIILLSLFAVFLYRVFAIAQRIKDRFYGLIVIGFFAVYFFHFLVNIGMTIGIMPVIGIPLPFVSYGGTAIIINLSMLGIIFNIARSHQT